MAQVVTIAELGKSHPPQQAPQHPLLSLDRMAPEAVDGPPALRKPGSEKRIA